MLFMMAVLAIAGTLIYMYYSGVYVGAFVYGGGVGVLSFLSTAATVSLLTGKNTLWRAIGAFSFVVRYTFVAGAIGLPAYLGLWPAVPMAAGFAGVYLAENFMLLPGVVERAGGKPGGRRASKRVERRTAA